jgi:hypothetical protein
MAIGAAGLLGIEVEENFDHPFAARNLQEFWNRWHMTLLGYLRDVMFAPLSKRLVGVVRPKYAHHAIAAAIVSVFLVIGTWHGVGLRFALYGSCQRRGRGGLPLLHVFPQEAAGEGRLRGASPELIKYAATGLTFAYNSASLFLFANSWPDAAKIFQTLR